MKITKTPTYKTPEGEHSAIVRDAFEQASGCVRIVFEIRSTTHPLLIYLAGKNYKPKDDFTGALIAWVGVEAVQEMVTDDGTIDLEKLKGLPADIYVEHLHTDAYDQPYVFVKAIATPGTFYFGPSEKAA